MGIHVDRAECMSGVISSATPAHRTEERKADSGGSHQVTSEGVTLRDLKTPLR